ncbi:Secretory carrier-associated membrane protein 6 [Zea mays]|uniref:Secretory carrier-associated membrane protein n=1 Tax=Zea mays TaxID=4577 RepID=A0A3L6F684_MAIZE|nr:Secretory carrier-associated membrane protein 6 [Zea mays]
MATATRRLLPALLKTLAPAGARGLSTEKAVGAAAVVGSHTAKWMQDTSKKSPMELINEVPPIKVDGRIAVCEGASEGVGLGHPIEYICLDLEAPNKAAATTASVPSRKSWLPAGFGGSGKHGATIDIPLGDPKKKERELLSWEQELKRREQDIKRREDAMNRAGVTLEVRNWPQFYPIIHHDIASEIPIHAQKLQYTAFASWLGLIACLVWNLFAVLVESIHTEDIVIFLLAVIYAIFGCPLSYMLWYRPLYRAMRTDSVVTFGQFFIFYSVHVGFCVVAAIAPPIIFKGKTLTGILVAIEVLDGDIFAGVLYLLGFALFTLESFISIWVLEICCKRILVVS